MTLLAKTAYTSFGIQILTGGIDVWALRLNIPEEFNILRDVLILELIVQLIEGVFYMWLLYALTTGQKNVTQKRYWDWFLTTPMMLFSLMAYMHFLRLQERGETITLREFTSQFRTIIFQVIFLNFLMLLFGYLGEIGVLSVNTSVLLGFIPFGYYFYLLHKYFASGNTKQARTLYWYFAIVWSVYGVAAFMPYQVKNTMYNILDLFAKNFFGIFLAYILYVNRVQA
jgi:bacteriorhodopsin